MWIRIKLNYRRFWTKDGDRKLKLLFSANFFSHNVLEICCFNIYNLTFFIKNPVILRAKEEDFDFRLPTVPRPQSLGAWAFSVSGGQTCWPKGPRLLVTRLVNSLWIHQMFLISIFFLSQKRTNQPGNKCLFLQTWCLPRSRKLRILSPNQKNLFSRARAFYLKNPACLFATWASIIHLCESVLCYRTHCMNLLLQFIWNCEILLNYVCTMILGFND